jgi:hypothetical protein
MEHIRCHAYTTGTAYGLARTLLSIFAGDLRPSIHSWISPELGLIVRKIICLGPANAH